MGKRRSGAFSEFTPEQIKTLRENLWVKKATTKMVTFTEEFKEEYWRLKQTGKSSRQVLEDLGIDPGILGRTRVEGIQLSVKEYIAKKEAAMLSEPYTSSVGGNSVNFQMKRLQHRLDYAEQQIEFIKKTILLDRQGRSDD